MSERNLEPNRTSKMEVKVVNCTLNSILMFERVLNAPIYVKVVALTLLYWQVVTQLTFTSSKSTIKTLEKAVKYVQN